MNIQLIESTCDYPSHKLRSAEEPSQHLPMRDWDVEEFETRRNERSLACHIVDSYAAWREKIIGGSIDAGSFKDDFSQRR
jgi:hypothetical protein